MDNEIFELAEQLADEVYDYIHYSERQELTIKFYNILKNKLMEKHIENKDNLYDIILNNQNNFSKSDIDILKYNVEKCKNEVDIFNIFYTTKKFLKDG